MTNPHPDPQTDPAAIRAERRFAFNRSMRAKWLTYVAVTVLAVIALIWALTPDSAEEAGLVDSTPGVADDASQ